MAILRTKGALYCGSTTHQELNVFLQVFLFSMENPKIILSISDAALSLELGEDAEDVLNEVSLPAITFILKSLNCSS